MKKYSIFLFLILIISVGFTGCGGGSSGGDDDDDNDDDISSIYGVWNSDSSAAILAHEDGDVMAVTSTHVAWTTSDGTNFMVYYGDDNLPSKAIVGDYVILYDNWTASTVDIAVIDPEGTITLYRELNADADAITTLSSLITSPDESSFLYIKGKNIGFSLSGLAETLRFGGELVAAGLCGAAIGTAIAGTVTAPVVLVVGAACAPIFINVVRRIDPALTDNTAVGGAEIILTGIDLVDCGSGNAVTCATLINDNIVVPAVESMAETEAEVESEVETAGASLAHGGGAIQVTLTWSKYVDLDLHVIDPDSEEIYFAHPTSASGGYLDADDRDGGSESDTATENIYWESDAPSGSYTVEVDYFATGVESGAVSYTVLILIDGETYGSYSGSFSGSSDPDDPVATFSIE